MRVACCMFLFCLFLVVGLLFPVVVLLFWCLLNCSFVGCCLLIVACWFCSLRVPHCGLFLVSWFVIILSCLFRVFSCLLPFSRLFVCWLLVVRLSSLFVVRCVRLLFGVCSSVLVVSCLLFVVCCGSLSIACLMLFVGGCLLFGVCCLLVGV